MRPPKDRKPPRYLQIKEHLKHKISENVLKPEEQIPTEAELMELFGVSRVTVNAAIRQLAEEGLVYRIAGKGTFVASNRSGALRIGFVMPIHWDAALRDLFIAVERACRVEGIILSVKMNQTSEEEMEAIRDLIRNGMDGLIIYPLKHEIYNGEILKLITESYPFVLVDKYLQGIPTNAVYSDNHAGGMLGTQYLIDLGHRNIGILSEANTKTSSADDRFLGYMETARTQDLVIKPDQWLIGLDDVPLTEEEKANKIRQWLIQQPAMTAVFSFNRMSAVTIAQIASELGKNVPEDLAILSFDNPEHQDLDGFQFSFIQQNCSQIGAEAVRLLTRVIKDPSTLKTIVVPVSLHVGRTT